MDSKFRVWSKLLKKMITHEELEKMLKDLTKLEFIAGIFLPINSDSEVMQHIGLKDIECTEIYVGDFLKDEENFIWEVLPLADGMFKISCDDLLAVESAYPRAVNCKIIGNTKEKIKF